MSATDLITVYVKNLAGDLFPLEVEPTLPLHEIANQLSMSDPEAYPIGRVQLLRLPATEDEEGDEKEFQPPLSPEEVLAVVIMDSARLETGVWPQGGQPYTRLVIPFRGRTLYLYLIHGQSLIEHRKLLIFGVSWSSLAIKPSETIETQHYFLYKIMTMAVPDVTPSEMAALYEAVTPYYEQQLGNNDYTLVHYLDPTEPVKCGCGSVIKRSSLKTHEKTKKHMLFVQQQQE